MGRPSEAEIKALVQRLAEPLEGAYMLGRNAHPEFDIPREVHAAAVIDRLWRRATRRRAVDVEARLREAIPCMAAEDMYFVIACNDAEHAVARECFLRTFTPTVCRVFERRGLPTHASLTLARAFLADVLYLTVGRRTRLAPYAGESSLSTYLTMLAQRHAEQDGHRWARRGQSQEAPDPGDDDPSSEEDPEGPASLPGSLVDIYEMIPRFTTALTRALLTEAQVIALHHSVIRGQAQVDIARLLKRTPGPVSRLLARATGALTDALLLHLSRKDRDAIASALHGDDRQAHAVIHAAFLAYLDAEYRRRSPADPGPTGGMSTNG